MEDVFKISYNTSLDKHKIMNEKIYSKIFKVIKKNKIMTLVFSSFIALSTINFYLIYSFMKILEQI